MDPTMVLSRKTGQSRHEIARRAVDEFTSLTLTKPSWPRSNRELTELLERIKVLRGRRIIHEELKQPGYTIDESFSGSDKYIRFTPTRHRGRFVVNDLIEIITTTLPKILVKSPMLKVNASYNIEMYLINNPDTIKNADIRAETTIVTRSTNLVDLAKDFFARISRNVEMFTSYGSGWVIQHINYIQLSVYQFKPATGSSWTRLPESIIATRSCINVKNDDNKCVLWALLSALFPVDKNPDRVSNYRRHQHAINMTGIDYPTPISQIPMIEQQNRELFPGGINVFSFDESGDRISGEVFPWLISPAAKHVTDGSTINLLWYNDHYVYIKDLSRLMSSGMSGYKSKMYFCYSCLNGFTTPEKLTEHNRYCFEVAAVTTPNMSNNILEFNRYERTRKMPFVIVGDFESFIKPINTRKCFCDPDSIRHPCDCNIKITSTQCHVPASYRLNTICVNDKYSRLSPIYRCNHDDDVPPAVHMLKYLFEEQRRIENLLSSDNLEEQQRFIKLDSFKRATICYYCKKPFTETKSRDKNPKVAFYNVVLDRYIGAVHQRCRNFQQFYPVIFHNLKGYDGHFIVSALGHPEISQYCADNNISFKCIPSNTERLMSITVGKLRFIDSFQFMATSLDQLARVCTNFPITSRYFDESELKYITVKGIFPYEYFDGPARFAERSLPQRYRFYSSVTDTHITDEEYQRALTTWDKFMCKTFGDYHDLYLTVDVLLLSDVFENFRTTSMKHFGLDPAYYYSAPGLAWDAALKSTGVKLELLTDVNMYLFIEKAIRGGISVITKKYSIANNKYLQRYNPTLPDKFIIYLDMNNLYGAAMSLPMPYGGFKWISVEDFLSATSNWQPGDNLEQLQFKSPDESAEILSRDRISGDEQISYYVQVDVDYPEHLHDAHNDYPYLASKMIITDDMLSREQLALRTTKYTPVTKLVPTLLHRRDYVCHYAVLKQALDAGLILRKVHRVLRFNHSAWLKPYIDGNTTRRAAAKNDFEKDFFKYMNNAVFGKTMENIRNRIDVEIVNKKTRRDKLTRNSRFNDSRKITDWLSLITKKQPKLYLDKPVYVGAAVLELSKTLMYDFHYGFVKVKWPHAELLFTDTDSLVYEIPGKDCSSDIYQDIYDHRELFDLSDVPGQFNDVTNKKVIGKLKDEFSFTPIREFVGLRSKMYAILTDSDAETKKAKGINNNHVKNRLKFNDYLTALTRTPETSLQKITTHGIRSHRHGVFTDRITKTGLCNFDDKRVCIDGVNTYAIGHYRVERR